jgi:hypothetical protein
MKETEPSTGVFTAKGVETVDAIYFSIKEVWNFSSIPIPKSHLSSQYLVHQASR